MNDCTPFEYATIQYVHDTVTAEFLNVGLVLYAPGDNVFLARVLSRYGRIAEAFPDLDGDFYRRYAERLQSRLDAVGRQVSDPQMPLDALPSDLEGLLSTVFRGHDDSVRLGQPLSGVADDLAAAFQRLYDRLVTAHLATEERESRTDPEVWRVFRKPFEDLQVAGLLHPHRVDAGVEEFAFPAAWKNGAWNVMQAISLDLMQPASIRKKAREWLGAAHILETTGHVARLYLLIGESRSPLPGIQRAYGDAVRMLSEQSRGLPIRVIVESAATEFAVEIAPVIVKDTQEQVKTGR